MVVVAAAQPRRLVWLADTLQTARRFPAAVRGQIGFALYLAQIGRKHESAKPLHGFDVPVWEVRAESRAGAYRAAYVVHLDSAVYVLHVFQKKATTGVSTPRRLIELIRQRLKQAIELDAQGRGKR